MIITIINFIKNYKKYLLLSLIIIATSYIVYLNINIISKKNKIKDLSQTVSELKATNYYLYKDLTVKSNYIKINDSFSNSNLLIDSITSNRLNNLEIISINNIIADYYKTIKELQQ